jgi:hypothetical protein
VLDGLKSVSKPFFDREHPRLAVAHGAAPLCRWLRQRSPSQSGRALTTMQVVDVFRGADAMM